MNQFTTESESQNQAVEKLERLKTILQRYGEKKKMNFDKIQKDVLCITKDLCVNHKGYLNEIASVGRYLRELNKSSDPGSHGTFREKRGKGYILGLFRELGLNYLLKGKI